MAKGFWAFMVAFNAVAVVMAGAMQAGTEDAYFALSLICNGISLVMSLWFVLAPRGTA